jgi:hypothetical protein
MKIGQSYGRTFGQRRCCSGRCCDRSFGQRRCGRQTPRRTADAILVKWAMVNSILVKWAVADSILAKGAVVDVILVSFACSTYCCWECQRAKKGERCKSNATKNEMMNQSANNNQQYSLLTLLVEGGSHWMWQWTLQIHHWRWHFGCCQRCCW